MDIIRNSILPFVIKTNLPNYCTELDSIVKENITVNQAIHFAFISTQIESTQIEKSESAFDLLTVQEDGSVASTPNVLVIYFTI